MQPGVKFYERQVSPAGAGIKKAVREFFDRA
jgi:hypothetical protein